MSESVNTFNASAPRVSSIATWRVKAEARPRLILWGLVLVLIMMMFLSLGLGAVSIMPNQIVAILASKIHLTLPIVFQEQQEAVLWSIRLPRILGGCLVGIGLGVAGASTQGLFRNPLADPGLIGVTSGAALGAVSIIVLETWLSIGIPSIWLTPIAAFAGGWVIVCTVHRLSQKECRTSIPTLLLAGIALNALCGAGIGLLSYLATDAQLRSISFWTMGSLGGVDWTSIAILFPIVLLSFFGLFAQKRVLNALLLGESEAGHIGFDVESSKKWIVFYTTLLTGAIVSMVGMIGFVGLIVPHLLRLWIGADHRYLLVGSAILGALLLIVADLMARLIVIPAELPIGIVTALFGAPFFIMLLKKEMRRF